MTSPVELATSLTLLCGAVGFRRATACSMICSAGAFRMANW